MNDFAKDVLKGLSSDPKFLPSKYFYDEAGSKLFEEIMHSEEYYLTDKEFEIMETHGADFLRHFQSREIPFDLIELGSGNGIKTQLLLEYFVSHQANFRYSPIDISGSALEKLTADVHAKFPSVQIHPIVGDYFHALEQVKESKEFRKVLLFMGGNIGNFSEAETHTFLKKIHSYMNPNDLLVIGIDLWKNPLTIEAAYNDSTGYTREFNLNLLKRINRELGANFNVGSFMHYPTYDIEKSEMKSYLVSKKDQIVHIEELSTSFSFGAWEYIHTEISKKYSVSQIEKLATATGFQVEEHVFDGEKYFTNSIWKKP
ncbi:MAG: L-histidine N(alpha)-methyltransferase [Bacteroidota bacterium]